MSTTTTRTDAHRPSVADPAEYTEVGFIDLHPEDGGQWIDDEADGLPEFQGHFAQRGGCDHCGVHTFATCRCSFTARRRP